MKANLRRSHLANTHHLITRVAAALALNNYNDIWKIKNNSDFLSITIFSKEFQWLEELINSFIFDFRIKRSLISVHHSKLLLIPAVYAELICFCDWNNQQCLLILQQLAQRVDLNSNTKIRILYIMQCFHEALFTSSLFIDHLEISPRRLKGLAKIPFSNSYGPHVSLSFGHFAFLIESTFASQLYSMERDNLSFDNLQYKSNRILKRTLPINLIYDSTFSSYHSLDMSSFFNSTQLMIHDFSPSLLGSDIMKHYYFGDSFTRYSSLEVLAKLGILTLSSSGSFTPEKLLHSNDQLSKLSKHISESVSSYASLVSISPQVQSFIDNCSDNLIVIHSRDAAYSGSANNYRDTNFTHYKKLIDYLIEQQYLVVRISRESVPFQYKHTRFLDLSTFDSSLCDQLFLLNKSKCMIGTASGISHWWMINNIPTLFVNTTALPCAGITSNVFHSPKRLTKSISYKSDQDSITKMILSYTWNNTLCELVNPRPLSDQELIEDVKFFIESLKNNFHYSVSFTMHNLFRIITGNESTEPDYLLTPKAFYHLIDFFTTKI